MLQDPCGSMDVPVSYATLARALRIAALMKELPGNSPFRALPPSHQAELLKLDAPERIELLALKAQEEAYTVKRLRAAVRKASPKGRTGRGRHPAPAPIKALRNALAALDLSDEEETELDEEELKAARELAARVCSRAAALARGQG